MMPITAQKLKLEFLFSIKHTSTLIDCLVV